MLDAQPKPCAFIRPKKGVCMKMTRASLEVDGKKFPFCGGSNGCIAKARLEVAAGRDPCGAASQEARAKAAQDKIDAMALAQHLREDKQKTAKEKKKKEPPPLYCLCLTKYDARRFMIQCSECEDFFHPQCVEMTLAQAKALGDCDDEWDCPRCLAYDPADPADEDPDRDYVNLCL